MKYNVIDLYDGGSGTTVVSSHRTQEAAEREADRLNGRLPQNSLQKYGIAVVPGLTDPKCKCGAGLIDQGGELECSAHPYTVGHFDGRIDSL